MSVLIFQSENAPYITLKVQGEINRVLAMEYIREAHALGKELKINCYLMDLTESQNTDSVLQNYNFAYQDMKTDPDVDRFARVALVVRPDDHSHDFVEIVSRNAGQNVRIFTDHTAAMDYFLNKTADGDPRRGC